MINPVQLSISSKGRSYLTRVRELSVATSRECIRSLPQHPWLTSRLDLPNGAMRFCPDCWPLPAESGRRLRLSCQTRQQRAAYLPPQKDGGDGSKLGAAFFACMNIKAGVCSAGAFCFSNSQTKCEQTSSFAISILCSRS